MPGAVLPPYAEPSGPELPLGALLDSFLEGGRSGFSEDVHIEADMLLAARMIPIGVRVGSGRSLLLRNDIPPQAVEIKQAIEEHLEDGGLLRLDPDTRLGDIAALQVTGIRGGSWDLWGSDPETGKRDLERAALGEDVIVEMTDGPSHDLGSGMTLDELLDELRPEEGP